MASYSIPAKEAECEGSTVPNWLELPKEITANIFQRLDTIDIVTSACQVCPLWWNICKDPILWHTICMINLRGIPYDYFDLAKICSYAIKRSCGHLEDINIESFCSDDLLECIAENASNLRCMRLISCRRISDEGFSEAVRKLSQLQEVDISCCNLSKDSLEVLGRSCPLLKSLKFAKTGSEYTEYDEDDEAVVIAKTMPGLRHLIIVKNYLTDVGLIAILDGCPLLETLQLEQCCGLSLSVSLWNRCFKQIKDFRPLNVHIDYDSDGYVSNFNSISDDDDYIYDILWPQL